MPNVFNELGFISKGYNEVRSELARNAQEVFGDLTGDSQLRVDDSSVLGRIFGMVSLPIVQNAEIIPLILQSLDINQAEGQQLDNLLWNIHRIKRNGVGQASGMLILYGKIGTTVSRSSEVGNFITGDSYLTDETVKFSNVSTNGVDIEINSIEGIFTLSYTVDGRLSDSPNIVVQKGSGDTSTQQIAYRFVDAINSQSSYLTASRNNDNSVKVVITDPSRVGTFTITGNAQIVCSYMPVYVTSNTYSSKESLANQVNVIRSATLGWFSATNPFRILPSTPIENDEDYRYRAKLNLHGNPVGKYNAILFALKSVRGVTYENVQEVRANNYANSECIQNREESELSITVQGEVTYENAQESWANNSANSDGIQKSVGLSITVQGGDENEIAVAIFNSVSDGIATSGTILKEVKDINGFGHEVRFSRPQPLALQITMSLVTYADFPSNGHSLIKQSIVEWFNSLNVGEDIHYSRLYEPINNVRGFAVRNLKFGYKGGTLGAEDIIIYHNEIATISAEDISIGGN